jgi:hypothetical protein
MSEQTNADAAATEALRRQIDSLQHNVVCIPEGFPGADTIRRNIEEFLRKGSTKVAHLIMLIHERPQA